MLLDHLLLLLLLCPPHSERERENKKEKRRKVGMNKGRKELMWNDGKKEGTKELMKEGRNKVVRLVENCAPSKSLCDIANLLKKQCSFPNF